MFTNLEAMWLAVLERDARGDGVFVYGVTSTRIFCRPSCPARRPKRENVAFFADALAAREAGFRPCRRCRPESVAPVVLQSAIAARLLESANSVGEVAAHVGVSSGRLRSNFQSATGVSPREFAETARVEKLKNELRSANSVLHAQNEAEFGSSRALYDRAPSRLGMTPASYSKGGEGAQIRFAVAPCELGFLLVARTAKGVCSVALGTDEAELEAALRKEFFAAQIERDDEFLSTELEHVLALLSGQIPRAELPLDVRATAFQARVWRELTQIPRGETLTYAQLAQQMGQPTATRAVASACAKNPVALVHPCHRVIGSDGKLRGFRWCVERKKKLLEIERKGAP